MPLMLKLTLEGHGTARRILVWIRCWPKVSAVPDLSSVSKLDVSDSIVASLALLTRGLPAVGGSAGTTPGGNRRSLGNCGLAADQGVPESGEDVTELARQQLVAVRARRALGPA
jgi:hypothetical protein